MILKNKRVPSAPYSAPKAGIRNMTHTLAMEWALHDIRVNSVSPGLVNTAMTYWVPQQEDWEQQLKYYGGFPRLAEVQELGGAYVYLLSDAASYTTSIDIPVNGVIGSGYFFSLCFESLGSRDLLTGCILLSACKGQRTLHKLHYFRSNAMSYYAKVAAFQIRKPGVAF